MTRIATLILVAALALAVVGCGSSSGTPSTPNVEGSKQMLMTTPAEQASMCDWFARLVGGYGASPACAMWVISAPPSQAACLDDFPACAVTVATFETCVNDLVAAQATCTMQSLDTAKQSAACATVGPAGCFD